MSAIGNKWLLGGTMMGSTQIIHGRGALGDDLFTIIRLGDLLRIDGDRGVIEIIG